MPSWAWTLIIIIVVVGAIYVIGRPSAIASVGTALHNAVSGVTTTVEVNQYAVDQGKINSGLKNSTASCSLSYYHLSCMGNTTANVTWTVQIQYYDEPAEIVTSNTFNTKAFNFSYNITEAQPGSLTAGSTQWQVCVDITQPNVVDYPLVGYTFYPYVTPNKFTKSSICSPS
jgi:hypothetical protein